jgi:uncharacterized membrane protein
MCPFFIPSSAPEENGSGKNAAAGWGAVLLAHHPPEEYYRCLSLRLGGRRLWLCARCCGLYPTLLVLLVVQFVFGPAPGGWDWPWLYLPVAPFLVDWYGYRVAGRRGSNFFRVASGMLLALSLSRALYLHIIAPFNEKFAWWCVAMAAFVVVVEMLRLAATGRGAN